MSNQTILGCEYNWWLGDPLPKLNPLDGFLAAVNDDVNLLAQLHNLDTVEMQRRFDEDNLCYVAYLNGVPAGYGWVATMVARIIEVGLSWTLAPQDRHLWDFVTLPAYRGRGVYPHLLQAILRTESQKAEHFWIGHSGNNLASQRGIIKAGFNLHWLFVLTPEGKIDHQPQDMTRLKADPRWPIIQTLFDNGPLESLEQVRELLGSRIDQAPRTF